MFFMKWKLYLICDTAMQAKTLSIVKNFKVHQRQIHLILRVNNVLIILLDIKTSIISVSENFQNFLCDS